MTTVVSALDWWVRFEATPHEFHIAHADAHRYEACVGKNCRGGYYVQVTFWDKNLDKNIDVLQSACDSVAEGKDMAERAIAAHAKTGRTFLAPAAPAQLDIVPAAIRVY